MVDRIGQGSLARTTIEAALKRQAETARRLQERAAELEGGGAAAKPEQASEFAGSLAQSIRDVDAAVRQSDRLSEQAIAGQVTDFAQAAAQIKEAGLAFKFALEVRDKFVDAYREVMRMNV